MSLLNEMHGIVTSDLQLYPINFFRLSLWFVRLFKASVVRHFSVFLTLSYAIKFTKSPLYIPEMQCLFLCELGLVFKILWPYFILDCTTLNCLYVQLDHWHILHLFNCAYSYKGHCMLVACVPWAQHTTLTGQTLYNCDPWLLGTAVHMNEG